MGIPLIVSSSVLAPLGAWSTLFIPGTAVYFSRRIKIQINTGMIDLFFFLP